MLGNRGALTPGICKDWKSCEQLITGSLGKSRPAGGDGDVGLG